MTRIAAIGVQTFGPRPDRHDLYEIAVVLRNAETGQWDREIAWWIESVQLRDAEPHDAALFYRRMMQKPPMIDRQDVAGEIAHLTAGSTLVAVRAATTERFLERLLDDQGFAPAWQAVIDAGVFAAGHLAVPPPWELAELARLAGVDQQPDGALGAARLACGLFDRPFSRPAKRTRRQPEPERDPPAPDATVAPQPAVTPEPVAPEPPSADEPEPAAAEEQPKPPGNRPDPNSDDHHCEECGKQLEAVPERDMTAGEFALFTWSRYRRILCLNDFKNAR